MLPGMSYTQRACSAWLPLRWGRLPTAHGRGGLPSRLRRIATPLASTSASSCEISSEARAALAQAMGPPSTAGGKEATARDSAVVQPCHGVVPPFDVSHAADRAHGSVERQGRGVTAERERKRAEGRLPLYLADGERKYSDRMTPSGRILI
jgi:hypothetical protein